MVVDASVLVNAVADDAVDGQRAREALRGEDITAPALVDVEVVAVLRKRWLAGEVEEHRFADSVRYLTEMAFDRYPLLPLLPRAYALRSNVTPYDAMYVALAERLDCPLLTGDRRLARSPGLGCTVRLLD